MRQWPKVRMSELFHLERGKIGIKAAAPGAFPLVTTGEEFLTNTEPHFSGDSICIPLISATGHGHASLKRLHHIDGDFAVGSILCACVNRAPQRLSTRYVFFYLSARKDAVLIPLMQGTANMSMTVSDIAGVEIPLPPIAEQHAIVSRLDTLADKVRRVNEHLDAIERDAGRLLAVRFRDAITDAPMRPMAEVAPLVRREIAIDPEASYTELGIRSFYKGTFQRRTMEGANYSWQSLFAIREGDLIFSNIMAWEQAIAIAKPEDDGCVGNHRMLTCEVATNKAVASFLYYYFTTTEGFAKIDAASPGTAARNKTLKAPDLTAIEVPIPSLVTQRTFDALQAKVAELKDRHATIRQANDALIPATLERVFSGNH